MKLLIEEYQYDVADVADVLDGLFTLQDVEQRVSVSYVGYYYNPHERVKDVVFILPKVLISLNFPCGFTEQSWSIMNRTKRMRLYSIAR